MRGDEKSVVLLGHYDMNNCLRNAVIIGEVNNHWNTLTYDAVFSEDPYDNNLSKLENGDSLKIILVTSTLSNAKCYCRSASISMK